MYKIATAGRHDHANLVRLARTGGAYTRDFSNHMFSGEAAYERGWIVAARGEPPLDDALVAPPLLGFYCVRHKIRTPVTELYFIAVDPVARPTGVGRALMQHLIRHSPRDRVELNCMKDNSGAMAFYYSLGFQAVGDSLKGKAVRFMLQKPRS